MMPIGDGSFCLYLNGNVRKASGTGVGDRVEVEVRFDAKYRSGAAHPMPVWFQTALRKSTGKKKLGSADSEPKERNFSLSCIAEVSGDPRARNLARALQMLSGKPERFMARSWNA